MKTIIIILFSLYSYPTKIQGVNKKLQFSDRQIAGWQMSKYASDKIDAPKTTEINRCGGL
jgi:hypothetical protein